MVASALQWQAMHSLAKDMHSLYQQDCASTECLRSCSKVKGRLQLLQSPATQPRIGRQLLPAEVREHARAMPAAQMAPSEGKAAAVSKKGEKRLQQAADHKAAAGPRKTCSSLPALRCRRKQSTDRQLAKAEGS